MVAFPFGTGHQLGAGSGGRLILPAADLPPKPWREIPVLRYGNEPQRVRLLCGYLQCDALNFRPLRNALPTLLHVSTPHAHNAAWLRATIDQIVDEVDSPRSGGLSMLERLTEISFIELLRHRIIAAHSQRAAGWRRWPIRRWENAWPSSTTIPGANGRCKIFRPLPGFRAAH